MKRKASLPPEPSTAFQPAEGAPPPRKPRVLSVIPKWVIIIIGGSLLVIVVSCIAVAGVMVWRDNFGPPLPTPQPTPDIGILLPEGAALCEKAFAQPAGSGVPRAPVVTVLNHNEYGNPWHISGNMWDISGSGFPSIEAAAASEVQTLVCIKESRVEAGVYVPVEQADSSLPNPIPTVVGTGYQLIWGVRLVQWPGGAVLVEQNFLGDMPPEYGGGIELGSDPRLEVMAWLHDVLDAGE